MPLGERGPSSFGDWTIYTQSQTITCPGTKTDRRTSASRAAVGDRRRDPRPCVYSWGRVIAGETAVRHRRIGCVPAVGDSDVLPCPECRCPIEFQKSAARAA